MKNIKRGNIFNAKILKFNTSEEDINFLLGNKNDFRQHTKFTWANKIIPLTIDVKSLEFSISTFNFSHYSQALGFIL